MAGSDTIARYRAEWPKLIGVEMEAGGVASAAFEATSKPGVLMVRGVSDLADQNKDSAQVAGWREYACKVAAMYAVSLLKSGPVPFITAAAMPAAVSAEPPIEETGWLREKLNQKLRTASEFDAFCLDYFSSVYRQFSAGMNRVERTTLLLSQMPSTIIDAKLRSRGGD